MNVKGKTPEQIYSQLIKLRGISENAENKFKLEWEKYDDFYLGAQWDINSKTKLYDYNSNGKRIVVRDFDEDNSKMKIPKRTQNEVFIQVQSELSLYVKQNYTVKVSSLSENEDLIEKANKQSLYLNQVFKEFQTEYLRSLSDVIKYGWGFKKLIKRKSKDGEIPFIARRENPKDIWVDPNADRFENINWIIHDIKKYGFELSKSYGKKVSNPEKLVKISEYWIKNNAGRWNRFVVFDGRIINDNSDFDIDYPLHPFAMFTAYFRDNSIYGISEIKMIWEYQKQINKRLSQKDHYLNFMIFPPTAVNGAGLTPETAGKLPLQPAQYYELKGAGTLQPIPLQTANPSLFNDTISNSVENISRTTGVTKAVEGQNEQGVYSAKHFSAIFESAINRLKLKEVFYKKGLVNFAKMALLWGQEFLGKSGKFSVYSPADDKVLEISASDLDFGNTDISFETSDANLLSGEGRLDYLIKMKQYAPEFPTEELILATESVYPNFFRADYIDAVKMQLEMKYWEVAKAYMRMKQEQESLLGNSPNGNEGGNLPPSPPPSSPEQGQQGQG